MSVKITGFDELQRRLRYFADRADALHGEHSLPLGELLTPEFLAIVLFSILLMNYSKRVVPRLNPRRILKRFPMTLGTNSYA
jgi:hypothetical protein